MTTLPNDAYRSVTMAGGETSTTYDFPVAISTDLVVLSVINSISTTLVEGIDYTVNLTTMTVNFTVARAAAEIIILYRSTPLSRPTDFPVTSDWKASVINRAFDRIYEIFQEIVRDIGRTLTHNVATPSNVSNELPIPVADALLGWNSAANGVENKVLEPGTTVYASVLSTNTGTATNEAVTPFGLANSNLAAAVAAATAALAALALPTGYFRGFTLSNNAGDVAHDIDVTSGKARSDDDTFNLSTTATIVKRTDGVFAEYTLPGTASGGMDSTTTLTGSPATVHVFMIGGTGKNTQPFFSTSIAPTLPTGFTKKRYVGSLWWTGTVIEPFYNDEDVFTYLSKGDPAVNTTSLNTAGALTSALSRVPTGVKVDLFAMIALVNATAQGVLVSSPDQTNVAVDVTTPATYKWDVFAGTVTQTGYKRVRTDTSGRVRIRSSAASVTGFWLWVDGYKVFR